LVPVVVTPPGGTPGTPGATPGTPGATPGGPAAQPLLGSNLDGLVSGNPQSGIATVNSDQGHVTVRGPNGELNASFLAFAGYQGPTFVDRGDVNADGFADNLVVANNSHVKVFDGAT